MRKRMILITLSAMILILSVITLAYYTGGVNNDNAQTASISTGTMELTFADGDNGIAGKIGFGETITKKFTITNTGSLDVKANLYWDNLINTYTDVSLMYRLEYASSKNEIYKVLENKEYIPTSETASRHLLSNAIYIPAPENYETEDTTYYYNLYITLVNSPTVDQTSDFNANLYTQFDIETEHINSLKVVASMPSESSPFLGGQTPRSQYEAVYTVNHTNIPSETIYKWDVSYLQNGSVMAWDMDKDSDGQYELYIGQEGGVVAAANSKDLFKSFINITTIDLSNLITSEVRIMRQMFAGCISLSKITIPETFDTSKVTDMKMMFGTNYMELNGREVALIQIENIERLNTSKVVTMEAMFQRNKQLISLDLSSFDTSNVENMSNMFYGCTGLETLKLTNFDTSNVENINYMFGLITSLNTLDIKNMTFNKVTTYLEVFQDVKSIEKIILADSKARTFIEARLIEDGVTGYTFSSE